jgi:hypothetical protein
MTILVVRWDSNCNGNGHYHCNGNCNDGCRGRLSGFEEEFSVAHDLLFAFGVA